EAFNRTRDNRGMMVLDNETEDFFNVSTPLGTLDHLQAQSQEQMASVCGIPLVILLGITPSGLNASSDGEIRTFYAWIEAQQEQLFTHNLDILFQIIQLSLFGEIDSDITYRYEPLWQIDETALATMRKTNADTDAVYIDAGVLDPAEVRQRVANEEDSLYHGLDLSGPPPEPPAPEPMPGAEPDGGEEPPDGSPGGEAPPKPPQPPAPTKPTPPPTGDYDPFAHLALDDAAKWEEGKHKRDEGGKFSSTGGGGGKSKAEAMLDAILGSGPAGSSAHAQSHHEYIQKSLKKLLPQIKAASNSDDPATALKGIKIPVKLGAVQKYVDQLAKEAGGSAKAKEPVIEPKTDPFAQGEGLPDWAKKQITEHAEASHKDNLGLAGNPYTKGTLEAEVWNDAWHDADQAAAKANEPKAEAPAVSAEYTKAIQAGAKNDHSHGMSNSFNPFAHGSPESDIYDKAWLEAEMAANFGKESDSDISDISPAEHVAAGVMAHGNGALPADNPNPEGTQAYTSWKQGWVDAETASAKAMEDDDYPDEGETADLADLDDDHPETVDLSEAAAVG
ncbi:MAG: anti-CBASS protein Acb1 family protein, partial [Chloroflexota bacterium]